MKTCTKCGIEKELGEFHKDTGKRDGLSGTCKTCRLAHKKAWREANPEKVAAHKKAHYEANKEKCAASSYKNKYGLEPGGKEELIEMQGGCCIMCNQTLEVNNPVKVHIDHCHDTGEIRGIMCSACNRTEGFVRGVAKRLDMPFSQVYGRMKEYSTQYVQGIEDIL